MLKTGILPGYLNHGFKRDPVQVHLPQPEIGLAYTSDYTWQAEFNWDQLLVVSNRFNTDLLPGFV